MTCVASVSLGRARRIASAAHVVAIVACVLIALLILAEGAVPAVTALVSGQGAFAERAEGAWLALIPALPLAFFLVSQFRLRQALDHYSDGQFFSPKPARHIASAGIYAVLAILAAAMVVPVLQAWAGAGRFGIRVEPEMAAMLAFALFVTIVGRVLETAAAIKAENDQIV